MKNQIIDITAMLKAREQLENYVMHKCIECGVEIDEIILAMGGIVDDCIAKLNYDGYISKNEVCNYINTRFPNLDKIAQDYDTLRGWAVIYRNI